MPEINVSYEHEVPQVVSQLLDKNTAASLGADVLGPFSWTAPDEVREVYGNILANRVIWSGDEAEGITNAFINGEIFLKDGQSISLGMDQFVKLLDAGDPTLHRAFEGKETLLRYTLSALADREALQCRLALRKQELGLEKLDHSDLYKQRLALMEDVSRKVLAKQSSPAPDIRNI